jgi:hypothetical protein
MIIKGLLAGLFLQLSVLSFAQSGDPALTIRQTEANGQKVVQVSFDGDKIPFGVVTITDSEGKIAYRMEEAELVPSPNYFTLDLSALPKGSYVMTIETKLKKYDQSFTIN